MVVFLHLSTLTTLNQCKLLYVLFDLSTLTTWAINTGNNHSLLSCIMVAFLYLSTLTTWNQCILSINCCIVSLIFRHSRHSFASNFLNNSPIFNPIELLELSQSPLSFCGVYIVFSYLSTLTTCFPLILVYFVSYISTVTTCTYKSYKHENTIEC